MSKHTLLLAMLVLLTCLTLASADESIGSNNVQPGVTHLGVKASQLVSLRGTGICPGFPASFGMTDRINPDGSIRTMFVVPRGKVLVVTDFDWSARSAVPGSRLVVRLSIVNASTVTGTELLATNPVAADSFGRVASHVHLTGGIVVAKRSATLCAEPEVPSGDPAFDIHVYGYLADAG
jgi:hypothetical protein